MQESENDNSILMVASNSTDLFICRNKILLNLSALGEDTLDPTNQLSNQL